MAKKLITTIIEENEKSKDKIHFSIIENGVLIKFDERDLNKDGHFFVPKGVTSIGRFAFNQTKIKSVNFPIGLKKIDEYAFYWCKHLSKVRLASTIQRIDMGAFCMCESLREINCPENLVELGRSAFKYSPVNAYMIEKVRDNQRKYARKRGVKLDTNGGIIL